MKRISTFIVSSMVAGMVFASSAFADSNKYLEYRAQSTEAKMATTEASATTNTSHLGNKYLLMQDERISVAGPSGNSVQNRTGNKYLDMRR